MQHPRRSSKVVDAENPPLRINLGSNNLPWVRTAYAERLATWEEWNAVSAQQPKVPQSKELMITGI
jgi:hypothetical protein